MKIIKIKDWEKARGKEKGEKGEEKARISRRNSWIFLICCFLFFSTLVYTDIQREKSFLESGGYNTELQGIIVKKGRGSSKTGRKPFYIIKYKYEGSTYKNNTGRGNDTNDIGDTVHIVINDKMPWHNCILANPSDF